MKSPSQFKHEEEARRERNWDPRLKWKVLQDTITWADRQYVHRNTREACLREQQRKACRASGITPSSSAG